MKTFLFAIIIINTLALLTKGLAYISPYPIVAPTSFITGAIIDVIIIVWAFDLLKTIN